MSAAEAQETGAAARSDAPVEVGNVDVAPTATTSGTGTPVEMKEKEKVAQSPADVSLPVTPKKVSQKPLPKEPPMTPRLKKKVPWKGKNITILIPLDDERGLRDKAPLPLRPDAIRKLYAEYQELGYNVDGFDLLVEGYQPEGTDDSQSRLGWPSAEDMIKERGTGKYKVLLPDLNAWRDYVSDLQEAKLRALGVSFAEEEPLQSISPVMTDISRQPSVQYPPLPFSPPIPTSSASSNHALAGFTFPAQYLAGSISATQSPGIPTGASPIPFGAMAAKFNPRQSISLPASASPFQMAQQAQGWPTQAGILHGLNRIDSPSSLVNFNGLISPQSAYGIDGFQQSSSPALNMHQRRQSLQFLPPQQSGMVTPQLEQVDELEEEAQINSKSPSKTPEPTKQAPLRFVPGFGNAEYHLEEQLRHQLEHDDYNPQPVAESPTRNETLASAHERQASGNLAVSEHFANDQEKPVVLHHPRPHSRGQSFSQNFFGGHNAHGVSGEHDQSYERLNQIPESAKGEADDIYEIETNPSNLGTPDQDFDFASVLAPPQRAVSTGSNPWQDSASVASNGRRPSHGNKASFSKLNVKAPEFKFNPTSNFTPGLFSFTGTSFQPAVFQAGVDEFVPAEPAKTHTFGSSSNFNLESPAFTPGKSTFSFSTLGPKFNPDAPAFTPSQPVVSSAPSLPAINTIGHSRRTDSIFGNITIDHAESLLASRRSKAIPIVRPSSRPSPNPAEFDENLLHEDADGRIVNDARAKRARSAAPEDSNVPLFANANDHFAPGDMHAVSINDEVLIDTSVSSLATFDPVETQQTTAAPSEISPSGHMKLWQSFDGKPPPEKSHLRRTDSIEKTHKKSLSATAPIFLPGAALYGSPVSGKKETDSAPLSPLKISQPASEEPKSNVSTTKPSPYTSDSPRLSPKPAKRKGLAASRFAKASTTPEPAPVSHQALDVTNLIKAEDTDLADKSIIEQVPLAVAPAAEVTRDLELTLEEIDDVMQQMKTDPSMGVNKSADLSSWHKAAVVHEIPTLSTMPTLEEPTADASVIDEVTQINKEVSNILFDTANLEDPFVDQSVPAANSEESEDEQLEHEMEVFTFPETEPVKRALDSVDLNDQITDVADNSLQSKLESLQNTLTSIQMSLNTKNHRARSTRREARSFSGEFQESDADDEDEEPVPHRSASPRKDRRMEQFRAIVLEAFVSHQEKSTIPGLDSQATGDAQAILKAVEDIKLQLLSGPVGNVARSVNNTDTWTAPEEQSALHVSTDFELIQKLDDLQKKSGDFEEKLYFEQIKVEEQASQRRLAEERVTELTNRLNAAETKVEVEIINRSVYDQRVADLEERLRQQEEKSEEEINMRRSTEDRLAEVSRELKHATEEGTKLREAVESKEQKMRDLEQHVSKKAMRMALLEAAQNNATQSQTESANKINALEGDLKAIRQDNNHWRSEAERADETSRRNASELALALEENKRLQTSLTSITSQLEENERLRESWRSKFMSLQDDMGNAARDIAEESARRIKKEQTMLARQEVLDARLQAEAKTRERLEVEMERLQENERSGMRAVNECQRLEQVLVELRGENHKLHQFSSRYQREFEEARESGANEVKRTRIAMQSEIETANNEVNVVRQELEDRNSKLRTELDNARLEVDTIKARHDMLLEEAKTIHSSEIDEAKRKHQSEVEDMQSQYERQVNNALDDGQRAEQALLERLSLSSAKLEHLQDRVVHLEDKLQVAKEAAAAAAKAANAKLVGGVVEQPTVMAPMHLVKQDTSSRLELPEKISPQALRESIMVLQEQLQAREQRIEELEQTVQDLDPDASSKIAKRDDEISWLRELLAVRHSDLQDIIGALSTNGFDRERVKDAAIRLKANLQMEEQERERAMNGGSAINLPNIAQSLQAATPRVAQTIGSSLNAWDRWRKSSQPSFLSGVLSSPAASTSGTPSRRKSSVLSGLLTPPASGLRASLSDSRAQPTAFASTGRRYPSQNITVSRTRNDSNGSSSVDHLPAQQEAAVSLVEETPEPVTPPMVRQSGYDSDAQPGDFDDHDFFED